MGYNVAPYAMRVVLLVFVHMRLGLNRRADVTLFTRQQVLRVSALRTSPHTNPPITPSTWCAHYCGLPQLTHIQRAHLELDPAFPRANRFLRLLRKQRHGAPTQRRQIQS